MNSNFDTFQNSGYIDHRTQKQILILHIDGHDLFEETLQEELRIDKLSDIYLDSLTTWDCVANGGVEANRGFILDIDQFEIKTKSNLPQCSNKIFIPNSATNSSGTTLHRAKKLNYICSINPTTLSTISGSFKLADGKTSWMAPGGGKAILEFIIIARNREK